MDKTVKINSPSHYGKSMDWPAVFTLKRADGVERQIRFAEDEPGWILKEYGFDLNQRGYDAWRSRMWVWLSARMREFSEGFIVHAFYVHPYKSIGGYVPNG